MSRAEIVINGKRFFVACDEGQESRLKTLGDRLDRRVKDMNGAMGDIGMERLLVAAALSVLDELELVENGAGVKSLDERISAVEFKAAKALTDAAKRIEAITDAVDRAS